MVYPDFPCDGQFSRAKPLIPTLLAIYSRYLGYDELGGWGWGRSQFFGFRWVGRGGDLHFDFSRSSQIKKKIPPLGHEPRFSGQKAQYLPTTLTKHCLRAIAL